MQNLIQVAGIKDCREAQMLVNLGVDWLGFPFRLPVHQEDISEAEAAAIIASLKPPHAGVLITYLSDPFEILRLCQTLGTGKVQLHGEIALSQLHKLREIAPQLFVIKSLIVKPGNFTHLESQVKQFASLVDAFITDTHDPLTGANGATGRTHDWRISRRLVEISTRPLILAGGLNAANLRSAILQVRPAGVDVHTGVEDASGRKSARKVAAFVAEARAAFALAEPSRGASR